MPRDPIANQRENLTVVQDGLGQHFLLLGLDGMSKFTQVRSSHPTVQCGAQPLELQDYV